MIPYFDAHCDTLYRCETTGNEPDFVIDGDQQAQREYFSLSRCLRRNGGHVDLTRGKRFCAYGQFFAIFGDVAHMAPGAAWDYTCHMHDRFLREMEENADIAAHCITGTDVERTVKSGKIAALLSIEGADLLDCDREKISEVADWGVRLINPVWNNPNRISGTNCRDTDRGLSDYGRDFIRAMEAQKIYADVSHLSDAGFWDLIHITKAPVIASHSNSRVLCPHPRNLTDDMFLAIRDSGGAVGINLYRDFVGGDRMEDLIRHVEHFLNLGGEKTLCLGGDLDGCEVLAAGMKGIEDVSRLYTALKERGYGEGLLCDIFWNNLKNLL